MNASFLRNLYELRINPTVKILIASYAVVWSGWGMISPILAVFMLEKIPGATIETVGFAISIYMITKSLVQLPTARYLDLIRGEKDEFVALFLGSLILSLAALGYVYISSIVLLFLLQVLYGIGEGLIYPSWSSLFSTHVDRRNMATEYSIYYTAIDITSAFSASLGALLAASFGYSSVFYAVSFLSFFGALSLIPMYGDLRSR